MISTTRSRKLSLRNLLSYLLQGPIEPMNPWILPGSYFDCFNTPLTNHAKINKLEIPSKSQLSIQKGQMFFAQNYLVFNDRFLMFIETCNNFEEFSPLPSPKNSMGNRQG